MDQSTEFAQLFGQKFDADLGNIKFFINPERNVSADEIRNDAVAFQTAINVGLIEQVASVD